MLKIENVLRCSNPLMHKIEVVVVMDNLFGRHICTVMKLKLEKHIKQQRGGNRERCNANCLIKSKL